MSREHTNPDADPPIEDLLLQLCSADGEERLAAVAGLGRLCAPSGLSALRKIAEADLEPHIQDAARQAIERIEEACTAPCELPPLVPASDSPVSMARGASQDPFRLESAQDVLAVAHRHLEALRSGDSETRTRAAQALIAMDRLHGADAEGSLRETLDRAAAELERDVYRLAGMEPDATDSAGELELALAETDPRVTAPGLLAGWRRHLDPDDLVERELDELDEGDRERVDRHLERCDFCRTELERLRENSAFWDTEAGAARLGEFGAELLARLRAVALPGAHAAESATDQPRPE